jgi:hypothetical protein
MKFKNMKIAITDETHLKAVCDVLRSIGYSVWAAGLGASNWVVTSKVGNATTFEFDVCSDNTLVTLSDLLAMRDKMVKDNAKHRESGF